ncbi:hypothetical protein AVW11_20365 [Streptomyces amritsarensis]|uniref:Uncharacterized protein n=1 Tax=Streptomyces amritsarensis TaxID=681158 RepID=A0ABX3G012_9ACTN|nr:SDR family oxidoreductase [Streptomyces amritsarensis]OLZ63581.1 hypothetical protein AVW11_20365 [Streptomyces amritsarensis]
MSGAGAANGIGRATAVVLARSGARVAAADINGPGVEALRTDLAADGRSVTVVGGDVCDPDGNRAMVAAAVEAYGRLDVAVAGAGVLPLSDVREYAIEALTAQRVLDLGCGRAGPPGGVRAASRREYLAEVTGADAMSRLGEPEEVARVVAFLASGAASSVTGGWSLRWTAAAWPADAPAAGAGCPGPQARCPGRGGRVRRNPAPAGRRSGVHVRGVSGPLG